MKAISLHQPWASMIASGKKSIETRRWFTSFRGDLLIVSTAKPTVPGLPNGKALCIVELYKCRPMDTWDEKLACCQYYPGAYAWVLRNIRPIEPFAVRGSQGFYDVEIPEQTSRNTADQTLFSAPEGKFVNHQS